MAGMTLRSILDDAGCSVAAYSIARGTSPETVAAQARTCNVEFCSQCPRAVEILEAWLDGKATAVAR